MMNSASEVQQMILDTGARGTCEIFTDGGCEPNPGHGGWGVVILMPFGKQFELCGGAAETTNNRMEMTAALMALRCLPAGWSARVFADSRYVVDGMNSWVPAWKARGWKRRPGRGPDRSGLEVKNLDIWQALDAEPARARCSFEWVRGHAGQVHNERADELASIGRAARISGEVQPVGIPAAVVSVALPDMRLWLI